MEDKKKARRGCSQGRAFARSTEELNTFGSGLALMLAAFFALILLDMGAWWAVAVAVAAACALGIAALPAGKE